MTGKNDAVSRDRFPERAGNRVAVEVEVYTCNTKTGAVVAHADDLVAGMPKRIAEACHREFLQSQIEFVTQPHGHIAGVLSELQDFEGEARRVLWPLRAELGYLAAHPDLVLTRGLITDCERSWLNLDRCGPQSPLLITNGLHVHVDADRDTAIAVLNGLNKLVPLFVALSANSPTMPCRRWPAASHRAMIWGRELPTSGWPHAFADWDDFERHVADLRRLGIAESAKDLHFMVRPSRFGTIEVRAFDMPANMEIAAELAALVQVCSAALRQNPRLLDRIPMAALQADFVAAASLGAKARLTSIVGERRLAHDALEDLLGQVRAIADRLEASDYLHQLLRRTREAARSHGPDWEQLEVANNQRPLFEAGRVLEWATAASIAAVGVSGLFTVIPG